ncbi:MAG: prolyl oligopeptidase family serine peptidase [Solobacterium sp.]|nr:prolyl oligopeptidase family serine peptidase [Solobacterium sp.]
MEVKKFPENISEIELNRKYPATCLVDGLFEEYAKVNGQQRKFYTYLKPGLKYNRPCLVVAPDAKMTIDDVLENSFWKDFADQNDIFLHILTPEDGSWKEDGTDAEYMNQVYIRIQARQAYVTMQDNIYALGYGDGAVIAQQAVMKMSSEWSGLATFSDLNESALINAASVHGNESTGKTELSIDAAKVQVPVWMQWKENTGANAEVASYWKKQNDSSEAKFSNEDADEIYFPFAVYKQSSINEEKVSQVRITNGYNGELNEEKVQTVWNFLSQYCRHRGFGHKMLRTRMDPDAYGFTYHELEHQGFTRLWYEYVPEAVKKSDQKVPLVVCMHGRGGTADSFISLSEMSKVAEERNFIVIFPEACVYQQRPGGLRNILLWNGFYKDQITDDTGFILKAIDDVKTRNNIDETRIYACGQSSGGMMTSRLALDAPEVFAAVSPWSAIVDPDHELVLPEKIDPAVPYMFLFGDRDWLCTDRENGRMEYHVVPMIADFLENLMKLYKLDTTPYTYVCGEITYYVYMNENHVPMLIVGNVKDMTHANYPRESWIAYDQFLCHFSKEKDGTLLYMGRPVK